MLEDCVIVPARQSRIVEVVQYARLDGVRRRLPVRVELRPRRLDDWRAYPGIYPGALKEIRRRMRTQHAIELEAIIASSKAWIDFI